MALIKISYFNFFIFCRLFIFTKYLHNICLLSVHTFLINRIRLNITLQNKLNFTLPKLKVDRKCLSYLQHLFEECLQT